MDVVHRSTSTLTALAAMLASSIAAGSCPPPPASNPAPSYPPGATALDRPAEVLVALSAGECGAVASAEVEQSSGIADVDSAALHSVRRWDLRLLGMEAGARLLVPMRFGPASDDGVIQRMVAEWRRMQVAQVPLLANGKLPAYIPDPEPLGFESVAEAVAFLDAHATREPDPHAGVARYALTGASLTESWEVYGEGFVMSPTVTRTRLASDGVKAFWVSAYLCEASAKDCERVVELLSGFEEQEPRPTPPTPPRHLLDKYP